MYTHITIWPEKLRTCVLKYDQASNAQIVQSLIIM